jgi:hypothetical protein
MSNWPLLQTILNLEGFDFAAFILSATVAFFSVGFAVDYALGRQGMGPYWNSFRRRAPMPGSALMAGGSGPTADMSPI